MALTEEQIKNLKPGDPLVIHCTFVKEDGDGDIWMESGDMEFWLNPSRFSLPLEQPKHDPCRPFREGDVVRFRKVNGNNARCRYNGVEIEEGSLGKIVRDGSRNCFWVEFDINREWCLDAAYFELVTPVEELEPYSVGESSHTWYVYKDDDVVAAFNKEKYPNAKAAAEAERDRLNAEYRKEQENG